MNIFLLGKEYCFVGFNAKKEKENRKIGFHDKCIGNK